MAAGQVGVLIVAVLMVMAHLAAAAGGHPPGVGHHKKGGHHPPGAGKHKKSTPKPAAPSTAGWSSGTATFYGGGDSPDTLGGACGYGNVYTAGYGENTVALSTVLWDNGLNCGSCFEVACDPSGTKYCLGGSSIIVSATNLCPPAPEKPNDNGGWCNVPRQHLDMAVPAFEKLAEYVAGIVPIRFRRTSCIRSGGIRFKISGHDYFTLVTVYNVGGAGAVHSVTLSVAGGSSSAMTQNWGQNWQCNNLITGKALTITVFTDDGKSVASNIPAGWSYGQTYSGSQF